jgi:hypothetical protein
MKYRFDNDPKFGRLDHSSLIVNRFYWNLTVNRSQDQPRLYTGDQVIAEFDGEPELEAFVAGMALALSVLPESAVAEIDRTVGE